jgi:biopolymer transport protein TolQ
MEEMSLISSAGLSRIQATMPSLDPGSMTGLAMESDLVVQGVLLLLIAASVFSWTIILAKMYQLWTARKASERFASLLWETDDLGSIYRASLPLSASPTATVFHSGYHAFQREAQKVKESDGISPTGESSQWRLDNLEQVVRRTQQEQEARLERRLLHLATISSAAPFIGLFGTVWGIMNAFRGLSTTQASSIQAVAPGIAQALIATAIGLAAAIPAVVAYNYFTARVQSFAEAMDGVVNRFLSLAQRSW